jgi:two-component system sensor histidine kinase/response regulator
LRRCNPQIFHGSTVSPPISAIIKKRRETGILAEKIKILIVDDEPTNLKILKIRLQNDFELQEAASGEEALEVLKVFQPTIILLDIMMTGIDGFEVTEKIRLLQNQKFAKVILVSGKATIEDKIKGYRAGADDYITKPFHGEELKAKLRTFIQMHELETENQNLRSELNGKV